MEEYIPPEQRTQYRPFDSPGRLTFAVTDGETKTFFGREARIIEAASVAVLCGSGFRPREHPGNDEDALAYYQEHAFDLGTCPRKRAALAEHLIGLDSSKILGRIIHSQRAKRGIYSDDGSGRLAGMFPRWAQILTHPDPLRYVKICVNARTAIIHHVKGPAVGRGDDVDVAPRDGIVARDASAEAVLKLTDRDIETIIGELELWGDQRTARLLPIYLDGKLTPASSSGWESRRDFDADYRYFHRQMNEPFSKLQRLISRRQANMIELETPVGAMSRGRVRYYPMRGSSSVISSPNGLTHWPAPYIEKDENGKPIVKGTLEDYADWWIKSRERRVDRD